MNAPEATHCRLCSRPMPRAIEEQLAEDRRQAVQSPAVAGTPPRPPIRPTTLRAVRFLLAIVVLQVLPLALWFGASWLARMAPGALAEPDALQTGAASSLLVLMFLVGNAYLVAKTGEALGAGFFLNFVLACFPPLLPAVWARIGGKSLVRPYVFLLADVVIVFAVALMVREQAMVAVITALLVVPAFFYQLFGCAVREIAAPLGLNTELTLMWLCVGPMLLAVVLLLDGARAWLGAAGWEPLALDQLVDLLPHVFSVQFVAQSFLFQALLTIYLLVSWIIWVKVVFDGLRLPAL